MIAAAAAAVAAYVHAVLIGLDVATNALFGGRPYQTLSCRCGQSIAAGGWAARMPWPPWWRRHCAAAIFVTIV